MADSEKLVQVYRQLVYNCSGSEPPMLSRIERGEKPTTSGRRYMSVKEAAFCLQTTKSVLDSIVEPYAMGKKYSELSMDEVKNLRNLISQQERVYTKQLVDQHDKKEAKKYGR